MSREKHVGTHRCLPYYVARVPEPSLIKRRVINPGAVPFPARWEARPRSAFMAAMATSVARIGFAAARVEDVIELARASRRTFYTSFDNAEQCLFAAHAAILEDALMAVDGEHEAPDTALEDLMRYLAAWPAHAHVLLVAMPAAGPAGLERHEAALNALAQRLAQCLGGGVSANGISDEQLLQARFGAAQRLVQREVVRGRHRTLPHLVPVLSTVMTSLTQK
jgi:AcrR family transcriptional regulator